MKNTSFWRKVIPIAGSAIVLGFFMPWALVSCNGKPVMNLSAYQIAQGGRWHTAFGLSDQIDATPIMWGVLLAGILVLIIFTLSQRGSMEAKPALFAQVVAAIIGGASTFLAINQVKASWESESTGIVLRVEYLAGYWFSVFGLAGVFLASVQELLEKGSSMSEIDETSKTNNVADQLEKLSNMLSNGQISYDEYEKAKIKLLS